MTCSVYDYIAWIEVLRIVVSVLHLCVILQLRSSEKSLGAADQDSHIVPVWRLGLGTSEVQCYNNSHHTA